MTWNWGYTGEWVDVTEMVSGPVDYRQEDLAVGSILTTTYKGETFTVKVVPPIPINGRGLWRYVYEGERYRSLSAIAALVTGDPTLSGNRFFKLRRRRK